MSDQDFFFDEEDEKPARAEKAAPKSSSKTTGSKPAARTSAKSAPAKSAPSKSAPSKTAVASTEPEAEGFMFEPMSVGKGVAVLTVVCALLLGLAGGILIGRTQATSAFTEAPATSASPTTGGGSAQPLTQEQLNSGQLPAGHPNIAATSSTAATGN